MSAMGPASADNEPAAVFTLPISVVVFMRQPQYYTAPLFRTGVGLAALISLLMIAASLLLMKSPGD